MTEQTTEDAAQTVPDTGDTSAADSPTTLLDTVTLEETEDADGQNTPTPSEGSTKQEQVAPESYSFTQPEGSDVDVESGPVKALGEQAAKLGLSNEQAQNILDSVGPALTQHYQKVHSDMMEQWAEETRQDPEIGGVRLQQSLTEAKQAFATFDPDGKALEVLNQWGLVNHPAILGFAKRVRTAISDSKFVAGKSQEQAPQQSARQHFPGSDLND